MTTKRLQIHVTNDPGFMVNGCTIHLREGGPCWIIDPGLPPQAKQIAQHVKDKSLTPQAIVLTHGHMDHIAGIDEVRELLATCPAEGGGCETIPVHLAREEWPALSDPAHNLSDRVGVGVATRVRDPVDLPPGETLELDGTSWRILDTSGHSPGGRSFYCSELGIVFVGDALFAGSVGRVDFPHSDGPTLIRNIREHLMTLPEDTRVVPGHGPETTIGREKATNPFVISGL